MENKQNLIDESTLDAFKRQIRTSIFRSYYNMLSNQFSMNILYIVIITLEAIQILGLTNFHNIYSQTVTDKPELNGVLNIIDSLKYLYIFYSPGDFLVARIVLYLVFILFNLQFIFYIFFRKHDIDYKTAPSNFSVLLLRFFFFLNLLYQKILSIPIWINLFSFLQCKDSKFLNFNTDSCEGVNYYIHLGLSIYGMAAFLLISLLNCIFLNDSRPVSVVPWAGPQNKISHVFLFLKLFVSFTYVIKISESESPLVDIKICGILIFLIIITILRFFNHFFFHKSVRNFTILYEGAFLFNSVIALIIKYLNIGYTFESLLLQIVTSLFFGGLLICICDGISQSIIHKNVNSITNEHIAFYKLLLLLEHANDFNKDSVKKNAFLGLLQKHRLKCFADKCECHNYVRILNETNTSESKAMIFLDAVIKNKKEKVKKVVLDGAQQKSEVEIVKVRTQTSRPSKVKRKASIGKRRSPEESADDDMEYYNSQGEEIKDNSDMPNTPAKDCIYGSVKIFLDLLTKNFNTTSDLNLFYAYLMTYYMNNIYKALFELMKVFKRKTDISREFEIFYLQSEIEKIMYAEYILHKDDEFHIENVLTYNDLVNEVVDLMNQTAHETIQFWTEVGVKPHGAEQTTSLKSSSKNKSQIYEHAMNISRNIKKMKDCYTLLSDGVKFRNKIIIKLYSLFLEKIIFNEYDCEEIKERLKFLEKDQDITGPLQQNMEPGDYLSSFANMDEVGSIVISGNLHDMGKVLIVNHLVCSLFKYERDELAKHSINKMIPSYMSQFHDQFIKRYLETAKKHVLDQIRMVFGISSVGLLTPILLHVKIIPNLENSIRFIGLVKKMKKTHPFFQVPDTLLEDYIISPNTKDISFLMCNHLGYIFGITKAALKLYGIPLNVLYTNVSKTGEPTGSNKTLNIRHLFPSINFDDEEINSQIKSENGCILKLDTTSLKSAFEDYKEALQEGNSIILKSLKRFSASKAFCEHPVLVFSYDISFNDGQVPAKIYKIINVMPKNKDKKLKKIKETSTSLFSKVSSVTLRSMKSLPTIDKTNNNEKLTHNFFAQKLNNNVVEITSTTNLVDLPEDKQKLVEAQEISQMRRGNIFYEREPTELTNDNVELNKFKKTLISIAIPKQVKTFIICVSILILILLFIGLAEFLLTVNNSNKLISFIDMWNAFNKRNLLFSSIILYTRSLILIDNEIFDQDAAIKFSEEKRKTIATKISLDINSTIELNNNLIYYINNLDEETNYLSNTQHVYCKNLEEDFSITYKDENLNFIIDSILVKISTLLEIEKLKLKNKEDIAYYQKNLIKSEKSEEVLRDIFYIIENAIGPARFWIETVLNRMEKVLSTKTVFDTSVRDIICYTPFFFVIIAFLTFCLVLSRIYDYKISILRVFFLVDKSYGMKIVRLCNKFLENSQNFLKDSNINIESYLENATMSTKPNFRTSTNLILPEENNKGDASPISNLNQSLNSNMTHNTNNTHNTNTQPLKKRKKEKTATSITLANKEKEKTKEKETEKKKVDAEYIFNSEMEASKSNFRKSLCYIYLKLTILILLVAVYFAVIISVNMSFNSNIFDNSYDISLYMNRGWCFINFMIYFREMILQGKRSGYVESDFKNYTYLYTFEGLNVVDNFNLYYNKSYYIEYSINNLTSKIDKGMTISFLNDVVQVENILNSNKFCEQMKLYNSDFYANFQNDCTIFYEKNKGLRDSIGVISSLIKSNPPLYFNQPFETLSRLVTQNSTFIDNTEMYITQAILMEMNTLYNSFRTYIQANIQAAVVRTIIYFLLLVAELLVFVYVTKYLSEMLNKDKMILTIIPNEAISSSEKVRVALTNLKKIN